MAVLWLFNRNLFEWSSSLSTYCNKIIWEKLLTPICSKEKHSKESSKDRNHFIVDRQCSLIVWIQRIARTCKLETVWIRRIIEKSYFTHRNFLKPPLYFLPEKICLQVSPKMYMNANVISCWKKMKFWLEALTVVLLDKENEKDCRFWHTNNFNLYRQKV